MVTRSRCGMCRPERSWRASKGIGIGCLISVSQETTCSRHPKMVGASHPPPSLRPSLCHSHSSATLHVGSAKMWAISAVVALQTFAVPGEMVKSVCLSNCCNYLFVGSHPVTLWHIATGQQLHTFASNNCWPYKGMPVIEEHFFATQMSQSNGPDENSAIQMWRVVT